ncbi:MAG TPA: porin family protein [Mucilaginibacter sp.]|nr:porin family protein [Mucilaginibacter sp.]
MKRILFFAICLLAAGSVSAQTYYYGPRHVKRRPVQRRPVQRQADDFYRPRVGVEAGLSIANTVDSYDESYSTDNILAFHAGITATIPVVYPFSFQPEVLFSQKGFKAYTDDGSFTQRNNYIDVPLLANFRLVRGFNFLIGPQLNFPISTTNTFNNGFDVTRETYYSDNTNKSYVAGVVGFSIDLNPNVDIHGRYILDLSSNTYNDLSPIPNYRNQVWQFGIGIKFQ